MIKNLSTGIPRSGNRPKVTTIARHLSRKAALVTPYLLAMVPNVSTHHIMGTENKKNITGYLNILTRILVAPFMF